MEELNFDEIDQVSGAAGSSVNLQTVLSSIRQMEQTTAGSNKLMGHTWGETMHLQ